MGVAHHAVYPVWFEVGRSDWMRDLGFPYTEVEALGYYLMLTGLNVRYRVAARYDDDLTLHTRMSEVRSRTAVFAYELRRGADLIATGETQHICTDRQYRPARMPDALLTALRT
ncbi:acyl-CoA thioesterase [Deinococcus sp.]|uniref:acyl-CoA thioesterase n=1 Tax=Deinococcus sp. TaxID=47478 RepID=UPI003CC58B40